jgi:hypothetical protein
MPRRVTFEPVFEERTQRWIVSIPPAQSPDSKRQRLYFPDKAKAAAKARELRRNFHAGPGVVQRASTQLVLDATHFDKVFQGLGFSGLGAGVVFDQREVDFAVGQVARQVVTCLAGFGFPETEDFFVEFGGFFEVFDL